MLPAQTDEQEKFIENLQKLVGTIIANKIISTRNKTTQINFDAWREAIVLLGDILPKELHAPCLDILSMPVIQELFLDNLAHLSNINEELINQENIRVLLRYFYTAINGQDVWSMMLQKLGEQLQKFEKMPAAVLNNDFFQAYFTNACPPQLLALANAYANASAQDEHFVAKHSKYVKTIDLSNNALAPFIETLVQLKILSDQLMPLIMANNGAISLRLQMAILNIAKMNPAWLTPDNLTKLISSAAVINQPSPRTQEVFVELLGLLAQADRLTDNRLYRCIELLNNEAHLNDVHLACKSCIALNVPLTDAFIEEMLASVVTAQTNAILLLPFTTEETNDLVSEAHALMAAIRTIETTHQLKLLSLEIVLAIGGQLQQGDCLNVNIRTLVTAVAQIHCPGLLSAELLMTMISSAA